MSFVHNILHYMSIVPWQGAGVIIVKWHSGVTTSQYKCPLKPKLITQLSSLTGYSVLLLCRLLWSEAEVIIIVFIIVILSRGLLNVILNTKVIYSDFCISPLLEIL